MTRARAGLFLLMQVVFLVFPAHAQYSEQIDVSVANIDVVVRDKEGRLVRGLTRDDFEVFENRKLQTITNFSAFDQTADPSSRTVATANPSLSSAEAARAPRLFVVYVDVIDSDRKRKDEFFTDVQEFLHASMEPGDFVTVLTWKQRVRVTLPLTTSRRAIDTILNALKGHRSDLEAAVRLAEEQRLMEAATDADYEIAAGLEPTVDVVAERDFLEFIRAEERCARIKRKARELRNMLVQLTSVELKKVLIFASDDMDLQPRRGCNTTRELEALANTANAYGITIHAFHIAGNRDGFIGPDRGGFLPRYDAPAPGATEYARTIDEASGLLVLAKRTGGVVGIGRMSDELLEQAAEELDVYYSIAYRLSPGDEDKPRKITVRTKDRRYQVRTRESVTRLSDRTRQRDLLTASLYLPRRNANQENLSFTARVPEIKRDGRLRRVDVELSIRTSDLLLLEKNGPPRKGSFSVLVAAGRELGDASDVTELDQEFAESEVSQSEPIVYTFSVRVRPDTRRLAIAVRDNNTGEVSTRIVELPGRQAS